MIDHSAHKQFLFSQKKRKAQVFRRSALEDLQGGFRRHSRAEATRADGAWS